MTCLPQRLAFPCMTFSISHHHVGLQKFPLLCQLLMINKRPLFFSSKADELIFIFHFLLFQFGERIMLNYIRFELARDQNWPKTPLHICVQVIGQKHGLRYSVCFWWVFFGASNAVGQQSFIILSLFILQSNVRLMIAKMFIVYNFIQGSASEFKWTRKKILGAGWGFGGGVSLWAGNSGMRKNWPREGWDRSSQYTPYCKYLGQIQEVT